MTQQALTYLMFSGNCLEALNFYKDCLGGEITHLRTVKDAPFDVPPGMEHRIFDSEFQVGNLRIKASDDMPGYEVTVGSNFAIFVVFSERGELESAYNNLSVGGNIMFPLENKYASVIDKFKIHWMLVDGSEG